MSTIAEKIAQCKKNAALILDTIPNLNHLSFCIDDLDPQEMKAFETHHKIEQSGGKLRLFVPTDLMDNYTILLYSRPVKMIVKYEYENLEAAL